MDVHFTEKLIKEVRKRPIIYLTNHPDYKNNAKKLHAWQEIQRELNVEVKILKSKWKNLKDTYSKFKQSKRSNSSQAVKKLSKWTWAESMNFIDPSVSLNDTNEPVSVELSSADIEPDDTSSSSEQIREVKHEIEFSAVDETQNAQETYPMLQFMLNRRRSDEKVEVKCDGVDLLFLGYADTFKKLSRRKQVTVKFDIAKVLMEAELSDLQDTAAIASAS